MRLREFHRAYNEARVAYHDGTNDFDAAMDYLVQHCNEAQWQLVQEASKNRFPAFSIAFSQLVPEDK